MLLSDLALSKRLERAEGRACVEFAAARRHLFPDSGAESMKCAGADAVFDGVESPVTQTFGLALFEKLTPESLKTVEHFFLDRGAPVQHEVSPFVDVAALCLLCANDYEPIEISSVLYREVQIPAAQPPTAIRVRIVGPDQAQLWSDISARGWSHEHPELRGFLQDLGAISVARAHSRCFIADYDGQPGAAGVLCVHDGVALFGGSATTPEFRRRGLQTALLQERMRDAFEQGCDLAMMVAQPGSNSHRNAERAGFRVAYTRMKWRLRR